MCWRQVEPKRIRNARILIMKSFQYKICRINQALLVKNVHGKFRFRVLPFWSVRFQILNGQYPNGCPNMLKSESNGRIGSRCHKTEFVLKAPMSKVVLGPPTTVYGVTQYEWLQKGQELGFSLMRSKRCSEKGKDTGRAIAAVRQ